MVETPGKCLSPSCGMARSGRTVHVSLGTEFICPDCGGELYPPLLASGAGRSRSWTWASPLVGWVVAGGYVVALAGGFVAGRAGSGPPPPTTVIVARQAPLPPPVQTDVTAHVTAGKAVPGSGLAEGATGQDQPFSPVPETGGVPIYPAEMAADGRPGRVSVTCRIATDGTPKDCRAASASRPFAAAALTWLRHGHVRYHPVIQGGHAVAVTRSWTIVIENPSALAATTVEFGGLQSGSDLPVTAARVDGVRWPQDQLSGSR